MTAERQKIWERGEALYFEHMTVNDAFEIFRRIKATVPDDAYIDKVQLDYSDSYSDSYTYYVMVPRLETDEEFQKRQEQNEANERRIFESVKADYERLAKKYPGMLKS